MSAALAKPVADEPVVRLKLEDWGDIVRKLAAAQKTLTKADADARSARNAVKTLDTLIRDAMKGRRHAKCGKATLTAISKPGSAGLLTQTNGTTVPFPLITGYLIGDNKQEIAASDVRSISSGRAGSESFLIEGEP